MSYEILYKRFLVKDGDKLIPHIIHGSNNCYEATNGKRERCVSNLLTDFGYFKDYDKSDLRKYLGEVYKELKKDDSFKGLQKTKQGFIDGFYKKIIDKNELDLDGVYMEEKLIRKFREKRKTKSTYELMNELKDKPFIEFNEKKISEIEDKTILGFNEYKQLIAKGKVKKLHKYGDCKEYGFFKSRAKRRYYLLYQLKYYKLV